MGWLDDAWPVLPMGDQLNWNRSTHRAPCIEHRSTLDGIESPLEGACRGAYRSLSRADEQQQIARSKSSETQNKQYLQKTTSTVHLRTL